jgi:hypothetical protein
VSPARAQDVQTGKQDALPLAARQADLPIQQLGRRRATQLVSDVCGGEFPGEDSQLVQPALGGAPAVGHAKLAQVLERGTDVPSLRAIKTEQIHGQNSIRLSQYASIFDFDGFC